jgi:hypothetical protein
MNSIKYYFNLWKTKVTVNKQFREYDEWCEIHNDQLNEIEYAKENKMPSIYWCWNCKFSDCTIH